MRGARVLAAACFAAGLTAGALVAPVAAGRAAARRRPPRRRRRAALPIGHPAEVLRVIDGDTFVARVHVWPGMDITTKVRLRGIDAPELHARCDDERARRWPRATGSRAFWRKARSASARVGQDKYGGRVDAAVSTASTPDVSEALLARGLARRYSGGRRQSWCG